MTQTTTKDNLSRIADWRKAQGHAFPDDMDKQVALGPYLSDRWLRDPKTVLFTLARYKFVGRMLKGYERVAEIGAGDGWASEIVRAEIGDGYSTQMLGTLDCYDLSPLSDIVFPNDIMKAPLSIKYDALYALDMIEHIADNDVFFRNVVRSLTDRGVAIIGTPSLESQKYASEPSRKLHINCMSGETLRALTLRYFRHVFLFSMNDEVVHTGFSPMAHYLFAVCAEPIR